VKIISVKEVKGWEVYSEWRNPMQIIETDEGIFTDNTVGSKYYSHQPGFNWSQFIGKSIQENNIKVIHKNYELQKYDWLKWCK
jgi:hypothetical protein